MKKIAFTILALVALAPAAHADEALSQLTATAPQPSPGDERSARDSVYVELLGGGLLYSVNYDHMFGEHFALRAGVSAWRADGIFDSPNTYVTVPLAAYGLIGSGAHKLELGGGVTPIIALPAPAGSFDADKPGASLLIVPSVGYRYAPRHSGFTFRAAFTPWVAFGAVLPSIGLSAGYQF